MAWITDSLTNAIALAGRFNPFGQRQGVATSVFTDQLALAAYMSSGMLRKVIAIPAADRTQKWRDWQADKDAIAKIEAEERRLGLRAKVKQAEVLRGLGGGALLLVTAGDHASELKPETIGAGGLIAINVLSRWQIEGRDWVTDLASPDYGCPRAYEISGDGRPRRIHPSRVIAFRGDPVPASGSVSQADAFWGDCRLLRVFTEVQRSDQAQAWFAELVRKAKLLRVGIPRLSDIVATEAGQGKLNARVALIATGESTLNATVTDAGGGTDSPGETITDYQVKWDGIPAMMDAFDQRVAAVSDIPFTRLMGRSPAGMNATGKSDQDNYWTMVSDGQENELRPCLETLDPVLLRSAGVARPDDVTWRWAPLWTPTEAEQVDVFDKRMDAITKLQGTGTIPDVALTKAVQNLLSETEDLPGLDDALAELPEDERFGLNVEPPSDPNEPAPSALQAEGGDHDLAGGGASMEAAPRRRAANDKVTGDA